MIAMLFLAAVFLPLYPLSIPQNALVMRMKSPWLRAILLLAWPQIGVAVLQAAPADISNGLVIWGMASAGFYALRLLTVRDLGLWASMLASSALALVWGLAANGADVWSLRLFALSFSLPAALLALLAGQLTLRFGAAYSGLYGGLADSQPRLAALLVSSVLAAIATPLFPGFFGMLTLLHTLDWGFDFGLLLVWLLWSWAGFRLLQGFLFGPVRQAARPDLSGRATTGFVFLLVMLVLAGLAVREGGL